MNDSIMSIRREFKFDQQSRPFKKTKREDANMLWNTNQNDRLQ